MRVVRVVLAAVVMMACASAAQAAGRVALVGYDWSYKVVVKDGRLEGGYNAKTGGTLALSGKINPDGSAYLEAEGRVGSSDYAVGGKKSGSTVKYYIDAKFSGGKGTGSRLTTRKCDFVFVRLD